MEISRVHFVHRTAKMVRIAHRTKSKNKAVFMIDKYDKENII
jgi:hypothetical protein